MGQIVRKKMDTPLPWWAVLQFYMLVRTMAFEHQVVAIMNCHLESGPCFNEKGVSLMVDRSCFFTKSWVSLTTQKFKIRIIMSELPRYSYNKWLPRPIKNYGVQLKILILDSWVSWDMLFDSVSNTTSSDPTKNCIFTSARSLTKIFSKALNHLKQRLRVWTHSPWCT